MPLQTDDNRNDTAHDYGAGFAAGALGDFEEALRESNIPFHVEAHDWSWLPEKFHGEIERRT